MASIYEKSFLSDGRIRDLLARGGEMSARLAEEEAARSMSARPGRLEAAREALAQQALQASQELAREDAGRVVNPREAITGAALQSLAQSAEQYRGEAAHMAKNALNGGEMSPGMGGRFDQQRYRTGCESLLNMVPLPCGGITKRPGFEFVAKGRSGRVRLEAFVFSENETRLLEFYEKGGGSSLSVILPDGKSHETGLALPWRGAELADVRFCQSADVVFCAHENWPPAKIMRHADDDWRFAQIKWLSSAKPPDCESMAWAGSWPEGAPQLTNRIYAVTAIDEDGNESPAGPELEITGMPPLSQSFYVVLNLKGEGSEFRVYRKQAGVFGFIGRVEPDEEGRAVFEDRNIAPDTEDTPPRERNPFDGPGNYPSLVFLHQQRLGFASSKNRPMTFWLSQSGNFESMAASVPPEDSDAIEATLAASQANRILWAESDRNGLAFGTAAGEWLMAATEGKALTPQDLSFQPQTYYGSQPGLAPIRAGQILVYAQKGGCAVREYGYSFQEDRYTGNDLSLLARHILRQRPIKSWAWQQEPYGIIWCALADGTLAGLTYLREHDIIAWHRHETAGRVEQVCAMPGPDGETSLWALVSRESGRAIERLAPFNDQGKGRHLDGKDDQPFQARCIPCLEEATAENGSSFLKVRKISAIKFRVINSKPFKIRVSSLGHKPSPVIAVPAASPGFADKADWAAPTLAGFRDAPAIELIMDGPDPVTILGMSAALELATNIGGQK